MLPKLKVSGSTSVRCWACASVYGSVLTWVTATLAYAVVVVNSSTATSGDARNGERDGAHGSGWKVRPGRCMGLITFSGTGDALPVGSAVERRADADGPRLDRCLSKEAGWGNVSE